MSLSEDLSESQNNRIRGKQRALLTLFSQMGFILHLPLIAASQVDLKGPEPASHIHIPAKRLLVCGCQLLTPLSSLFSPISKQTQ